MKRCARSLPPIFSAHSQAGGRTEFGIVSTHSPPSPGDQNLIAAPTTRALPPIFEHFSLSTSTHAAITPSAINCDIAVVDLISRRLAIHSLPPHTLLPSAACLRPRQICRQIKIDQLRPLPSSIASRQRSPNAQIDRHLVPARAASWTIANPYHTSHYYHRHLFHTSPVKTPPPTPTAYVAYVRYTSSPPARMSSI